MTRLTRAKLLLYAEAAKMGVTVTLPDGTILRGGEDAVKVEVSDFDAWQAKREAQRARGA